MERFRTRTLVAGLALVAASASWPALADRDNTARWETIIGIMQAGNVVAGIAGGNTIGTPGAITQVKGTLVCDTDGSAGAPVLVDTPLVPLSDDGNASFHGSIGDLPAACTSEPDMAFIVRIGAGRWIANGAVLR